MRMPPGLSFSGQRNTLNFASLLPPFGQIDWPAEMNRTERLEAARLQVGGARGGVVGGESGALDALAVLQEVARRLVLLGLVQHAEQLEIVLAEHDGVVAGAHDAANACRAARR